MSRIIYGNTTFDTYSGIVSTAENTAKIKNRQSIIILEYLTNRPGKVVSQNTLLDVVWDTRPDGPDIGIVPVLIHAVREALTTVNSDWTVQNIKKVGYILHVPSAAQHVITYTETQYKALHRALKMVEQRDPLLAAMIRGE